jgi:hypothetical protein
VVVIGQADKAVDAEGIALLGSGQKADEDLPPAGGGFEQISALKGPDGDLNEAVFGNEAQRSTHTPLKRRIRGRESFGDLYLLREVIVGVLEAPTPQEVTQEVTGAAPEMTGTRLEFLSSGTAKG